MLKLSVGKGRQVINSYATECCATVATERAGYVLYRALVLLKVSAIQNFEPSASEI